MKRFRFGEQEGPNGKKTTFNGWLAVWGGGAGHGGGKTGRTTLEIAGPNGGVRALVVMDQDTARKVGGALMDSAGIDTADLLPALKVLTEYCTSGRRYLTRNPYGVPEIERALKAIASAQGQTDWIDANKDAETHLEGGK